MIKVLHIVNLMNRGGIETYIMNVYRTIDRSKIQFDFIVNVMEKCDYDDEIYALGGNIYHITRKKDSIIKNFMQIYKIIKKNNYKIVERHTDSALAFLDVIAAKWGGARKVYVHSHNNYTSIPLIHKLCRPFLNILSIDRLACSKDAGKWLFNKKKFTVIHNAIDVNQFTFNNIVRDDIRKKYNLKDKIVIGHVGRFMKQKNHMFLIDVFNQIYKMNDNAILMLVGTGELENEIKAKVKDYELDNNVLFMGLRSDVNNLLQAMDCFVFPSLFEGLGIVLIEAQAAGLKCFTSENVVPKDAKVTELLEYIPLAESPKIWAQRILNSQPYMRMNTYRDIDKAGYNINTETLKLVDLYSEGE